MSTHNTFPLRNKTKVHWCSSYWVVSIYRTQLIVSRSKKYISWYFSNLEVFGLSGQIQQMMNWRIFSYFFFRNRLSFDFRANCLQRRFAWNSKACFLLKKKKTTISKCRLLKCLSSILSDNWRHRNMYWKSLVQVSSFFAIRIGLDSSCTFLETKQ